MCKKEEVRHRERKAISSDTRKQQIKGRRKWMRTENEMRKKQKNSHIHNYC